MRRFVLPIVLLSACSPALSPQPPAQPVGPAVPVGADDTCGAAAHAGLVGQPATALERVLIIKQVRLLRPGMAMTMDYSPDRINFEIDGSETITRIFCG